MANGKMSVGAVFSRAFGAMGARPLLIFGIPLLVVTLPSTLIQYAVLGSVGEDVLRGNGGTFGIAWSINMLTAIILSCFAQAALIRATVAQADGHEIGFGACLSAGMRAILPLIGLNLLLGIGVILGSFLLLVPGIIVAMMWAVAAPAIVEERTGILAAFGRSRFLTAGSRWAIFAILLIVIVLMFGILMVIALLTLSGGMATGGSSWLTIAVAVIANTFLSALYFTIQPALYVELRTIKGGPTDDQLADVFS